MIRKSFLKIALLGIMLFAGAAIAQNRASMTGTVTDVSGAALPGTIVTLTNASTGVRLQVTADGQGSYRFPNVPPGAGYQAAFSHEGFTNIEFKELYLNVGITRTQDAKLAAGANVQVEVTAGDQGATLNTTDASVGNSIDVQLLTELPIQSRSSPAALFQLQPGVGANSVTGARTDQTSVTLDGMDVNDLSTGQTFNINGGGAPVDSVQEFRAVVAGLTSNLGTGSGGQYQLVTKGGTNHFHGNLNEYHRDTTTTANTWFNNHTGLRRTPLIQNQFGGNIGGPILHDKLFFFADFNNSRIIQSQSAFITVPLDSFRNGNINYIYATQGGVAGATACPAATRLNLNGGGGCVGTLTPAQVAALDPQHIGFSQSVQALVNARYPHANDLTGGDGINTGYYRFTTPTPDILYQGVAKLDYQITSRQRIFARFTKAQEDSIQSVPFVGTDPVTSPFQDRSYGYVLSHTWQLGQNKVNQVYFGNTVTVFNFANTFNPTGTNQYSVGGPTTGAFLSGPYSSGSSQRRRVPIPMVRDDFNWQVGHHNFGFGGTFKFIKTNSQLVNDFNFVSIGLGGELSTLDASVRPGNIRGGTTAPNDYDGAFAFALGRIASVSSNYNYTNAGTALANGTGETRRYRYFQTELYLGDTWKITPHLTLDYGLRYQLYTVPYEVSGAESVQNTTFDQYFKARLAQSGSSLSGANTLPFITYRLGGKANDSAPLYNPSYKDFAPRVAFAWNPESMPKTVLTGSAALIYDRTVINAVNFIQDQSSFLFQNSANTQYGGRTGATPNLLADPRVGANLAYANPNRPPTITKPLTPFVDANGPYGLADNQFVNIVDPNLKDPYSIQLNAGIQQEFPGRTIMRLNYVGRMGRRLLAQADASQLVDFRDPASGQLMSTAFGNLTRQARAGQAYTAQPWFENQIGRGYTVFLANALSSLVNAGDFADYIQALHANGFLDYNVGMASQFAGNTFLTNKGSSTYHGMLLTVQKNLSQGLRFDFNYTWSHSVDNVSAVANFIASSSGFGFVCDATRPRECRANSDFDVTHVIRTDFTYQLPFGRGRAYAAHTPVWLDEVIGGWSLDGLPNWRSGIAVNTFTGAYVAGYANNAPATLVGNRDAVAGHVQQDSSGTVFLFKNQPAAANSFTGPIGLDIGNRNVLRGPRSFTFDAGLAKRFVLLPQERLNLQFRADFFNVLNHPVFSSPSAANLNINSASTFGRITNTSAPRIGQFSLRLEF